MMRRKGHTTAERERPQSYLFSALKAFLNLWIGFGVELETARVWLDHK